MTGPMKTLLLAAVMMLAAPAFGASPTATLSAQIVPAAVNPSVPAVAQAAGFTTLAGNYDFSSPAYADPNTNWIDCGNNDNSKIWHAASPGVNSINCNIHQKVDPGDGSTVMNLHLGTSDGCGGGFTFPFCSVSIQTQNNSNKFATAAFPNMYVETVNRVENTYNNGGGYNGAHAVWTWWAGAGPDAYEADIDELQVDQGGYGNDGIPNWAAGGSPPPGITGWTSYAPNNASVPAGYSPVPYHKYGMLLTSDGSSSIYACWFIDDRLQSPCQAVPSVVSTEYTARHIMIMTVYGSAGGQASIIDRDLDVKYIKVYTCAGWTPTQGSAVGMCNGSTLFNDGNLIYWH